MLAICTYYAGIMLNAFATYYAHYYSGIIGSGLPPRLLITSGMMWHDMNPNSLYMATVVVILGQALELKKLLHRNQPIGLNQLYISNKMESFSYKSGCGICVSGHLIEELHSQGYSYR